MKIRVEAYESDPRILTVLIDFTGYPRPGRYFPVLHKGKWYESVSKEVHTDDLDKVLASVKLRRITYWASEHKYHKRTNIYRTTVISDREI